MVERTVKSPTYINFFFRSDKPLFYVRFSVEQRIRNALDSFKVSLDWACARGDNKLLTKIACRFIVRIATTLLTCEVLPNVLSTHMGDKA